MSQVVINVASIRKYYGATKAVDEISFQLFEGEVLAILGPNGAGKTTTMEILEGLRKPDFGQIEYFEDKLPPSDERVKEEIGVQLQTSSFFDYLTVKETLELFRGLYKKRLPVKQLIAEVSLQDKARTYTKNLSGGQLHRLAVAVALVNDPRVVFLDEPTTGLDPQARRMLWDTVLSLKKQQKTIILTTHNMEEATYLADRIIIMDYGKIIAMGTLDELIAQLPPSNVVSFRLKTDVPLPREFTLLEGLTQDGDKAFSLSTQDVQAALAAILELSGRLALPLDDITIRRPNLEDVFLTLTGRKLRD